MHDIHIDTTQHKFVAGVLLPASTVGPVTAAWEARGDLPLDAPKPDSPEIVAGDVLKALERDESAFFTEGFLQLAAWVKGAV
jgi:hypothetical protein